MRKVRFICITSRPDTAYLIHDIPPVLPSNNHNIDIKRVKERMTKSWRWWIFCGQSKGQVTHTESESSRYFLKRYKADFSSAEVKQKQKKKSLDNENKIRCDRPVPHRIFFDKPVWNNQFHMQQRIQTQSSWKKQSFPTACPLFLLPPSITSNMTKSLLSDNPLIQRLLRFV